MRQLLPLHIRCKPPAKAHLWTLPLLCAGSALTLASPARAQVSASSYFPTGTAGYDQDLGVTVLSRLRPEYDEPGVQLDGFTLRPDLDQSIFDNTNVNGTADSGSWGLETTGNFTGQSNWSRNSLAAAVGFDHNQFFSFPDENYTNWNVGLGGGYTIGDSELNVNYAHSSVVQLGTTIGAARTETPTTDTTDTGEIGYTFNFGRFAVTPMLDFSAYRFGDITAGGATISQSGLNRNVIAGGIVTRYALTGAAGLLVVARGSNSNFINPEPGTPSNNSSSALFLVGLDYQTENVWRYSLLFGVEHRSFEASEFSAETAPIVSAQMIYTPTEVLTLTGNLTRTIEDPDATGTDGFVSNQGNLTADYELLRNVLLEGRAGFQYVTYLQGGSQTNETVGGSITWLLNRNMRLSLNDNYTNQNSPGGAIATLNNEDVTNLSGAYTQNILTLSLHLGL